MLSLVGYMSMTGNNHLEAGNNLATYGLGILPALSVIPPSDLLAYYALHLSHVSVAGTGERGIPLSLKS